jgi:uncharacterized radical SAM superfamily protein
MSKDLPSYFSYNDNDDHNNRSNAIDANFIQNFFLKHGIILNPEKPETLFDSIKQHPELSSKFDELCLMILNRNFVDRIGIYIPGNSFISISVTGEECDLDCAHCHKKYLKGMIDVSTEDKLIETFEKFGKKTGFQGFLISGGCTSEGKVPLFKFSNALSKYKKKYKFLYNLHVGLIKENDMAQLLQIQPDFISFDFTLDESIIKRVYHLEKTPQDYKNTLNLLVQQKLRVIPHICIGLNYGMPNKEVESLIHLKKMKKDWDLLVFLILIRPNDPEFALIDIEAIRTIFTFARLLFPTTELSLGCMRPRGQDREKIEKIAVHAGFNRFEMLSPSVKKMVCEMNLNIVEFNACCAIPMDRYKHPDKDEPQM